MSAINLCILLNCCHLQGAIVPYHKKTGSHFYSTSHQIPKHKQKIGCPAGLVKIPTAVFVFTPILGVMQVFVCIEYVLSYWCWPCYVAAANLFPQGDKKTPSIYLSTNLSVCLSIFLTELQIADNRSIYWLKTLNEYCYCEIRHITLNIVIMATVPGKPPMTSYSRGCSLTHKILLHSYMKYSPLRNNCIEQL